MKSSVMKNLLVVVLLLNLICGLAVSVAAEDPPGDKEVKAPETSPNCDAQIASYKTQVETLEAKVGFLKHDA